MYSVAQSCLTLCDPMDCSPPGSFVHGFSRQEYQSGLPCPPPGDLPNPGIESRSPPLHTDSLSSQPLEKLKNTVWVAFQLKYELEFVYDFDDFFFCTDYFFCSFVTPSNFYWKPGMLFWKLWIERNGFLGEGLMLIWVGVGLCLVFTSAVCARGFSFLCSCFCSLLALRLPYVLLLGGSFHLSPL